MIPRLFGGPRRFGIPLLFGITAGDSAEGLRFLRRVEQALDAGLPGLLVREPVLPDGIPDDPRVVLHARMPGAEARAAAGGLGLHVPSDMSVADMRLRFPGRLGASTHSAAEARAALLAGADYVFLSPIWKSPSKPDDARPPLGLDGLARAVAEVPRLPPIFETEGSAEAPIPVGSIIALGGITPVRVADCLAAGAHGVAVLGGIFGARDVPAAVRAYLDALYDQTRSS